MRNSASGREEENLISKRWRRCAAKVANEYGYARRLASKNDNGGRAMYETFSPHLPHELEHGSYNGPQRGVG